MKLENGSGQPPVHFLNKEQKKAQDRWQISAGDPDPINDQAVAVKEPDAATQTAQSEQGGFKALLAVDTFNIRNTSPQAFSSLLSDITRLPGEVGGMDETAVTGLSHFRVSLEVRMEAGQLDPSAEIDMQQYINEYVEQSENLSRQDSKTYGYSAMYANQSKQAIETYMTQSNLQALQQQALHVLKATDSHLIDSKA
ncbi:hypothetical protein [Pseudoalteromonas rubra]|uniref:Uncharacterized protein n=1 Tax=Pseudoalteromonas rubra TaxID=43658 RepID=A0A0F4QEZ7_9GAMM|nr:hypothetical protein [Pseudoalteromonas rubra]KJZ05252.1 hypothetical protein TW77_23030 [Pseudoalteromonas rubra]